MAQQVVMGHGIKYGEQRKLVHFANKWLGYTQRIPYDRSMNAHALYLGAAGAGKTMAGFQIIYQWMKKRWPVIVLSPHPDLFEAVVSACIRLGKKPEEVPIIDPTDLALGSPIINPLWFSSTQVPHEAVETGLSAFKSQWRENFGPRTEDTLRNLFVLLQSARLPLSQSVKVLLSSTERKKLLLKCPNEDVRAYWAHLGSLNAREFNLIVESPRNKLSAMISNPYVGNCFGEWEPTIDFVNIMATGKVCPINLSRDHLKTEMRALYGSVLLGLIDLDVIQLGNIPEKKRKPCLIAIDECHEVWNSDACRTIATGARKFGIGLFLLTQSLSNLPPADVDVLLGVIGNLGIFSCGRKDAERLVKEAFNFSCKQIKDAKKGTTYNVQEELESIITQVMMQSRQQLLFKSRGQTPWFAQTYKGKYPKVKPDVYNEFRKASAKLYYRGGEEEIIEEENPADDDHF